MINHNLAKVHIGIQDCKLANLFLLFVCSFICTLCQESENNNEKTEVNSYDPLHGKAKRLTKDFHWFYLLQKFA